MKAKNFDEVNVKIAEKQEEYETLPVSETGEIWLTMLTFGQPFHPILMSCLKPNIIKKSDDKKTMG